MANKEHLEKLQQGVRQWNEWRRQNERVEPDLSEVALSNTDLSFANLSRANLFESDLSKANLRSADLSKAHLSKANLIEANLSGANLSGANLFEADLSKAHLSEANLIGANLSFAHLSKAYLFRANLSEANLSFAHLSFAHLSEARLFRANLSFAHLSFAHLRGTNLSGANLSGANLSGANLSGANLSGANLSGVNLFKADLNFADLNFADLSSADLSFVGLFRANLSGANLSESTLSEANLSEANLNQTILVHTNLCNANLSESSIYGIAAWDIQLEGAIQRNLVITPSDQPVIMVDNLEIAQFIYLLLHNPKIREIIDTVAQKAVLILGRFTPERKPILEVLRTVLRAKGYVPILFDFEKPDSQDLTETVSTLAHLSRFIIADLTDPSCIPHEMATIVPTHKVPIVPLFHPTQQTSHEYAMFRDLKRGRAWILPIYHYTALEDLQNNLQSQIIEPAEKKAQELLALKNAPDE